MTPQRAQEIERAVQSGLQHWELLGAGESVAPKAQGTPDVLVAMPRRRVVHKIERGQVELPMARRPVYPAGIFLPFQRLFVLLWLVVSFLAGNALDVVRRRASVERRAVRVRELTEWAGGNFIKFGQQLSIRADLLPHAYCAELAKLLDHVPPMPSSAAVAVIERNLGRPLGEVFKSLDPTPIGSASLACVYQAVLKSGERVAVKVQRPGIGRLIAADLRALDWLCIIAETLTLVRPGSTMEFRRELRHMLLGELNFRTEARYNDLFRVRAEEDGDGITAPRVFFEYCTEEVLVNELVSGVWMWELMAAVDQNDQEFLAKVRDMGIEPGAVARRLIRALHRELLEHLFFHADPHPANLVVLPNSHICFIDFGAVGRFSTETRNTWRELQFHMQNRDIERMVHTSIKLAGRLPPVNVDDAIAALEEIYADWIYAVSSRDAEWWERSSAQNWLRYITTAREFGIPVNREIIQFFRATFLYDTIIVRLDKDVDPVKEWKGYARRAGKAARKRVQRFVKQRFAGPTKMDYLRIEQMADTANQFMFRLQSAVDTPILHFKETAGKIAYGVATLLRIAYLAGVLACLGLLADSIAETFFGIRIAWWPAVKELVATSPWVQLGLIVLALVVIRRLLIRMIAPEPRGDSRTL